MESHLDLLSVSTLADYRVLLARFFGFYAAIEPQVEATLAGMTPALDFDFDTRRKTPRLLQDLHALGWTLGEIDRLPRCVNLPNVADLAQIFGYLYVAEGSTLGGQILSRHFTQTLGVDETNGGAFFHAYGRDIGKRWREFQIVLQQFTATHLETSAITATAIQTFESIETWFSSGSKQLSSGHTG